MSGCQEPKKLSRRQKYYIALSSAGAACAYFAYRLYRSDSLAALLEFRSRLRKSLDGASKSLLLASECSATLLEDLRDFLSSDSDDVPQSLKQLTKLAKSQDVREATSLLAAAAVQGLRQGTQEASPEGLKAASGSFLEQLVDALTTPRGADLVTLAVGVACRTTVQAMSEAGGSDSGAEQRPGWWQQVIEAGCTPRGEKLYTACVGVFVKEGMKVWMGSMDGVNPWEDFFSTLSKAESQPVVDRMTRVLINELVASYFRKARHNYRGDVRGPRGPSAKQQQMLHTSVRSASAHALASEGQNGEGVQLISNPQPIRDMLAKRLSNEDMPEDVNASSNGNTSSAFAMLAQQLMKPEVRGLLTVVVGTAAFEGVRSGILATRELITGAPASATVLAQPPLAQPAQQQQQLTSRALGGLLLLVFAPAMLFVAGRRVVLP